MTFNFKYEDAGEIKTLSVGVKETGIHFNRSEAAIASTWRTYLRLVTHGDESYYMLEQINYAYAYTELSRFSNTLFKNNILSTIDWTDESCQLVASSGMHNFGRNEAGHYYQEITYGDGGSCSLQFFIYTNPETQQSYAANAGFGGFKPHGTNGWIALASNAQSNLIDDLAHSVRPNIMLLKATMTDDDATSPNYEQDFDVIIIVRKVYSGATEQNHIMIADERLFTGARRNDPSKSTAKGNTPNGFRGGRDDHSDSDTESHIGLGFREMFSGGEHGVRVKQLDHDQVQVFYNCLWQQDLWENFQQWKWNPIGCVLSLQLMPCDPEYVATTASNIKLGGYDMKYEDSGLTYYSQGKNCANYREIKTKIFHPEEYSHSFLDWGDNTSISFRLPFIGTVPIDTSKVMNGGIFAKYNIDFYTGNCLVQIYTIPEKMVMGTDEDWDEDYGGCLCMVAQYAGNCAHKIAVSGNDYGAGQVVGAIVDGISSAASIATGIAAARHVPAFFGQKGMMAHSIAGGVNGIVNAIGSGFMARHNISVIPASPNADTLGMMIPALIIERPIDITPLDENGDATIYENMNGRPAASGGTVKDYKSLDTGEGIFIKGVLHADALYATEDEKRQIEEAFARGVYL